MNLSITRRNILVLSTSAATTLLLPNLGFADPDIQPARRKPKKTTKTSTKKKLPKIQEEIEILEDQYDECSGEEVRSKRTLTKYEKKILQLQREIDRELQTQAKLKQSIKDAKLAEREFTLELRSGKNASGGKMTDRQRDAVVRKAARVIRNRKNQETDLQHSKDRVREMQKQQNALRKQTRGIQGLINKSKNVCRTTLRKLQKLKQ